jgi:hypothetical protein
MAPAGGVTGPGFAGRPDVAVTDGVDFENAAAGGKGCRYEGAHAASHRRACTKAFAQGRSAASLRIPPRAWRTTRPATLKSRKRSPLCQ